MRLDLEIDSPLRGFEMLYTHLLSRLKKHFKRLQRRHCSGFIPRSAEYVFIIRGICDLKSFLKVFRIADERRNTTSVETS
jgi:hypothetical protein